jgi:hypothetical protein
MDKQRNQTWALLLRFLLIPPLLLLFAVPMHAQSTDTCMHSFEQFAYEGIRDPEERFQEPMPPWKLVSEVFSDNQEARYSITTVELAREFNGSIELWLGSSSETEKAWVVYSPQFEHTELVPAQIEGTNLVTSHLYADNTGTLWASLTPSVPTLSDAFPALGMFNETQRRFDLVENVPQVTSIKVLQTRDATLWILATNDAVYSVDTDTQTFQERGDLAGVEPLYATSSPDNYLYFVTRLRNPSLPGYASLEQEILYRFNPETNELLQVEMPREWPIYYGLLFDSEGRLWLGSVGYRSEEGGWNLVYPNPERFLYSPMLHSRTHPTLLFASSDGRLWFTNFWDGGIWHNGTAWYNPNTGQGCMFTNSPATIVEDAEQQLWLVASGNLYKYMGIYRDE